MFVTSIKFKRTKDSEWEKGYYVADTDNSDKSVFLDSNYQPLPRDERGCTCWDYHTNTDNWIQFRCND